MKYKFTTRKPGEPYVKNNIGLQFWEEDESLREIEEFELEDGSIEERIVVWYYDKYLLEWREEFAQEAEYDEGGNMISDSYINENSEELLQEAKQQI